MERKLISFNPSAFESGGGTPTVKDIEKEAVAFARQNVGAALPALYVSGGNVEVTKERAFAQALEANPEAYERYRNQHNAKTLVATLEAAGYTVARK